MLWTSEEAPVEVRSERDLRKCIAGLDPATNPFGVLTRGGSHFIQVAAEGGGFIIEKRAGGDDTHFHARRTGGRPSTKPPERTFLQRLFGAAVRDVDTFTRAEVEAVLIAWYLDRPDPDFLRWEPGHA